MNRKKLDRDTVVSALRSEVEQLKDGEPIFNVAFFFIFWIAEFEDASLLQFATDEVKNEVLKLVEEHAGQKPSMWLIPHTDKGAVDYAPMFNKAKAALISAQQGAPADRPAAPRLAGG